MAARGPIWLCGDRQPVRPAILQQIAHHSRAANVETMHSNFIRTGAQKLPKYRNYSPAMRCVPPMLPSFLSGLRVCFAL